MSERFGPGDRVRVLADRRDGNPRTPSYCRGKTGVITQAHGVIDNPLDHLHPYPPLYTVVFRVEDVSGIRGSDLLSLDLHEEWLEPG